MNPNIGFSTVLYAMLTLIGSGCNYIQQSSYPYATAPEVVAKGNQLFDNNCVTCHNFRTTGIGPNLSGITHEVSQQWLKKFIRNPMQVIQAGDKRGVQLYKQYKNYMPPFPMLEEAEVDAILAYMHTHGPQPETPTRTEWGDLIHDPVPAKIASSGIRLMLKEYIQVPLTAKEGQQARINKLAPLPDQSKRLFVHDLRGKLYEIRDQEAQLFLDLANKKAAFMHAPGHGTGMGSFAFHPAYKQNGLFYTTHTAYPDRSPKADFSFDDTLPNKVRWILTAWKQKDPESPLFEGTQQEILRIDMISQIHGVQEISFNPLAQKGDEDYGWLYIGVGDGGAVGSKRDFLVQDKGKVWGCILRIDPLGDNSSNGKYGIPSTNPFVGEAEALGEIYAMGFRNPHRFDWYKDKAGIRMLTSDIGQHFVEELNEVIPGANYGWPEREGTFRIDKTGDLGKLYPLPSDDDRSGFTYPVAQFDHDEGLAICGGYVYQGSAIPALKGKYIFGEIVTGRVFVVNVADLKQGKQAAIQEVSLLLENGHKADWSELTDNVRTGHSRVDFRLGVDADGELYMTTKANGKIFQVIGGEAEEVVNPTRSPLP